MYHLLCYKSHHKVYVFITFVLGQIKITICIIWLVESKIDIHIPSLSCIISINTTYGFNFKHWTWTWNCESHWNNNHSELMLMVLSHPNVLELEQWWFSLILKLYHLEEIRPTGFQSRSDSRVSVVRTSVRSRH